MSKPGRKPLAIPRERVSIFVSQDILAEVKLILADPLSGQARWGGWTNLVDGLLREWVDKQRKSNVRLERRFTDRRVGTYNYYDERVNRREGERRAETPATVLIEGA
jgi:hypothetical protein